MSGRRASSGERANDDERTNDRLKKTSEHVPLPRTRRSPPSTSPTTSAQRALSISKNTIMAGSVVGVTIGCLMGASCLLFMDLNAADRKKQAQQLNTILETVMEHGDTLIEAER